MAFKMKQSPHKRGTIEGTESALKLWRAGYKVGKYIYKGVKRLIKGDPNRHQKAADELRRQEVRRRYGGVDHNK